MNAVIDLQFEHDYQIELIDNLPMTSYTTRQLYFPGASEKGGHDGVILKVTPRVSTPWVGIFSTGYISPESATGVFSCPDKGIFCVVSCGQGYFVNAESPEIWSKVQILPITGVYPIYEKQLIIFKSFTEFVAYQTQEIKWITPRLSWDGLVVIRITEKLIIGKGWDLAKDKQVEFSVDIVTGKCVGGASPGEK